MTGRSQEQCTTWNPSNVLIDSRGRPIFSNWKLTSQVYKSCWRGSSIFVIFIRFLLCSFPLICGSLIKKKLIIFGQIRYSDASNCKKDELRTDRAMKMFFLIIYFLEVLFIFRRTKTRPYFQIIFNNFSLESILYEFLTDTNIHCRNES